MNLPNEPYFYLAGPMRGLPLFNFPVFKSTAERIRRERQVNVVSPADRDLEVGFDPAKSLEEQPEFSVEKALEADFRLILDDACKGVILMEGWKKSSGAKAEAMIAVMTGRQVVETFNDGKFIVDIAPAEVLRIAQGTPLKPMLGVPSAQAEMSRKPT